jgi:hypothetical protein
MARVDYVFIRISACVNGSVQRVPKWKSRERTDCALDVESFGETEHAEVFEATALAEYGC